MPRKSAFPMARMRLGWWPLAVMYRKCCLQVSDIFFFRGNDLVDGVLVLIRQVFYACFPLQGSLFALQLL